MSIRELKTLLEIKNQDALILKISAYAEIFVSISGEKGRKCSKQLKLLRFALGLALFLARKDFHFAKLFVGDAKYPHVTVRRQHFLYASYMHISHFFAWAVADIDGKLKHSETIAHNILTESGILFPLLLGFGGKVE